MTNAALAHHPVSEADNLPPVQTTLLELIAAVADHAENDAELLATVSSLLRSGKVQLEGCFQGDDVQLD